mgnify:CR=1 FL=1
MIENLQGLQQWQKNGRNNGKKRGSNGKAVRSEERGVGKERRSRWAPKKKKKQFIMTVDEERVMARGTRCSKNIIIKADGLKTRKVLL